MVLALSFALAESAYGAGRLVNRCPRLSTQEYDEIDARVQLLLESEALSRALPVLVCTASGSWLEWDARRFILPGRAPLTDEVVDAVEQHLQEKPPTPGADESSRTREAVPAPSETPPPAVTPVARPAADQRPRSVAPPRDSRLGGGLLVSMETELPQGSLGYTLGPAFDFGANFGPLILGGREALRSTVADHQVFFMDLEGSVAYGAPLDRKRPVGAVLRAGAEWMIASAGETQVAPELDLGLRAGHSFGVVGLWVGVDARWRLMDLTVHPHETLSANDLSASLSIGFSFADWPERR